MDPDFLSGSFAEWVVGISSDMKDTTSIGTTSVGIILGALLKAGYRVLVPFGEHPEYDLVVERRGKFQSIQCKTGELKAGAVRFRPYTVVKKRGGGYTRRSYGMTVDFYGVFCPQLGQCFLIPTKDTPSRGMSLRIEPTRNSQTKGVRWAHEFRL